MATSNSQERLNGGDSISTAHLPNDLSSELSQLAALLSRSEASGADPDVEELLRRMETADDMARGLESRLDGMIDNLDALLKVLEPDEGGIVHTEGGAKNSVEGGTNEPQAGR